MSRVFSESVFERVCQGLRRVAVLRTLDSLKKRRRLTVTPRKGQTAPYAAFPAIMNLKIDSSAAVPTAQARYKKAHQFALVGFSCLGSVLEV